jgi:palmitoyl-protein thioesterase
MPVSRPSSSLSSPPPFVVLLPLLPLLPLLLLLLLLLLPPASSATVAYKPVIMMHGVGSDHHEMDTILRLLNASHAGTVATSLPLFGGKPGSWDHDLNTQVAGVADAIRALVAADPAAYRDGYHLVCKSQGALTCRCVIEEMDDHNVDTFVSLAGPQVGVYGGAYFQAMRTWGLPEWLVKGTVDLMWLVAYNPLGQKISVANMWRDPHHLDSFRKHDSFLPKYTSAATARMKANFVRVKNMVFCVGSGKPYDGGIEPWQTGAWGQWGGGASGDVMVNMTAQPFYVADTFGLKTMHESGRLNLTIVPGASHGDWTGNERIITKYVLPHCT